GRPRRNPAGRPPRRRAVGTGPAERADRPHGQGPWAPVPRRPGSQPLRDAVEAQPRTGSRPATDHGPRPMNRATRGAYRNCLPPPLNRHADLICLDTDTGLFSAEHATAAGEQYLNLGIDEHNLMGIAAGLAACGRIPFVNTMAAFATSRALEAVKIDIAYNQLP